MWKMGIAGRVGSEHVALLAVGGPDGLAALAGLPEHVVAAALRTQCCLAHPRRDPPVSNGRATHIIQTAIAIAEAHGRDMPAPGDVVSALLKEPRAYAWTALLAIGVTSVSVEAAIASRPERTAHPTAVD